MRLQSAMSRSSFSDITYVLPTNIDFNHFLDIFGSKLVDILLIFGENLLEEPVNASSLFQCDLALCPPF